MHRLGGQRGTDCRNARLVGVRCLRVADEIDDELRQRAREGLLLQHPTVEALNTLGTLELEDEARRLRRLNSSGGVDPCGHARRNWAGDSNS